MDSHCGADSRSRWNSPRSPKGKGLWAKTREGTNVITTGAQERTRSLGIWAWLSMLEKEKDKLSESGQVALALLREDLERIAE